MLYDPKWEVKADPTKLETLIAWLECQPENETYCFSSKKDCLIAQYGAAHGKKWDNLSCVDLMWMGFYSIAIGERRTFGAALARARKQAAESQ